MAQVWNDAGYFTDDGQDISAPTAFYDPISWKAVDPSGVSYQRADPDSGTAGGYGYINPDRGNEWTSVNQGTPTDDLYYAKWNNFGQLGPDFGDQLKQFAGANNLSASDLNSNFLNFMGSRGLNPYLNSNQSGMGVAQGWWGPQTALRGFLYGNDDLTNKYINSDLEAKQQNRIGEQGTRAQNNLPGDWDDLPQILGGLGFVLGAGAAYGGLGAGAEAGAGGAGWTSGYDLPMGADFTGGSLGAGAADAPSWTSGYDLPMDSSSAPSWATQSDPYGLEQISNQTASGFGGGNGTLEQGLYDPITPVNSDPYGINQIMEDTKSGFGGDNGTLEQGLYDPITPTDPSDPYGINRIMEDTKSGFGGTNGNLESNLYPKSQLQSYMDKKISGIKDVFNNPGKAAGDYFTSLLDDPRKALSALQMLSILNGKKNSGAGTGTAGPSGSITPVKNWTPQQQAWFNSWQNKPVARNSIDLIASLNDPDAYKKYGQRTGKPAHTQFTYAAHGGLQHLAEDYTNNPDEPDGDEWTPEIDGNYVGFRPGRGGGQADKIPAMLSNNEYVFDADVVAALGDGSPEEGARRLDQMREAIRSHKRSTPESEIPPQAKSPLGYMKEVS